LASGLGTTLASRSKSFLVLFFKKELLVFTCFFNFWTAWELLKKKQKNFDYFDSGGAAGPNLSRPMLLK
jgi:hypothetical protein